MAKFQWTAASEAVGQAPALLSDVCDGSLSDWEIVADEGFSTGKALKLIGSTGARRRLALSTTVTPDVRIDIRARFYKATTNTTSLHVALRNKGTTESDTSDHFFYISSSGVPTIGRYNGASLNAVGSGSTIASASRVGWWNLRLTYQPEGQAPILRAVLWSDEQSEASPQAEVLSTANTDYANINGDRICIGTTSSGSEYNGALIEWVTVGTDTDDADVAPSSVSVPVSFSGPVPNQNTSEGAAFSLKLAPYFSGTESRTYSVQAGTLPAGLTLNSTTGEISGSASAPGTSSGLVIRATDADENTADTNAFSITVSALTKKVRVRLYDGSTPAASVTGLSVAWFDDPDVSTLGAPAAQFADQATDADGWMDVPLTGYSALPIDGEGLLIVQKPNPTAEADLYFIGRLAVSAG